MRSDHTGSVTTFYAADALQSQTSLMLGLDAANHARALRLQPGTGVRLTDGRGSVGAAGITRIGRDMVQVDVQDVWKVESGVELHALVPVGDKERMLWLAEKAVEIGITTWRPVLWSRSRSVASRGEGPQFRRKLMSRMTSALEQCGGAWLPDIFPESNVDRSIAAAPDGTRLLLDPRADKVFPSRIEGAAVIVVGPEGGLDDAEAELFAAAKFVSVRVPANIMRFETAGVVAMALARFAQNRPPEEVSR